MQEILTLYPDILEREFVLGGIGRFIDEHPDTVTRMLVIFAQRRQDLFKE